MAEDAIRRWPNNPELSCLSCWVLRSVVEPPPISIARGGLEGGGVSSPVGDVVSYDSTQSTAREGGGGAESGRAKPLSLGTGEGFQQASSNREEHLIPGASMTTLDDGSMSLSTGGMSQAAGDGGGEAHFGGSTASGSVFGTGDNETSDLLISLDDGQSEDDERVHATAGKSGDVLLSGMAKAGVSMTLEASTYRSIDGNTTISSDSIPAKSLLPQTQGQMDQQQPPQDQRVTRKPSVDSGSVAVEVGVDIEGAAEAGPGAAFEGERDGEALERLIQLAEATKVPLLIPAEILALRGPGTCSSPLKLKPIQPLVASTYSQNERTSQPLTLLDRC